MKILLQGDSRYAVLYTWPDGWSVVRSLPAPADPNYVEIPGHLHTFSLHLLDASRWSVSTLNFWTESARRPIDLHRDHPIGHPHRRIGPIGSTSLKPWISFALDMILMGDDEINGRWGVIPLPFWIKPSVWERLDNPEAEAEIATALLDSEDGVFDVISEIEVEIDVTRKMYRFFSHVFEGYPILVGDDPDSHILHIALGPHKTQIINPRPALGSPCGGRQNYKYVWQLMNQYNQHMTCGTTLKDAFIQAHFPGQGSFANQVDEEAWVDSLNWGTPAMEFDLEPYELLDTPSPIIWPTEKFLGWYSAVDKA